MAENETGCGGKVEKKKVKVTASRSEEAEKSFDKNEEVEDADVNGDSDDGGLFTLKVESCDG